VKHALFIFLFFCAVSGHADELKKVSVQFQWKHQFEYAGFYAAIAQGYYKKEGFEVSLKEISPGVDPMREVLEGKSDFGVSYSSLIEEYYNGKPIVMLANIFKHSALVLVTQKEIVSPLQLKGKRVMGSQTQLSGTGIGMMLKHFGLSMDDLDVVTSTQTVDLFAQRKVDAMTAFITNEPYLLNKKEIPYNILSPTNYGSQFYDVNLFTSKALYESDPKSAMAFRKATIKGWEYALEHTNEVIALILRQYNTQQKSYDALKYEAEITKSLILPSIYPLGSIDCNIIKNMKQNFLETGMISESSALHERDLLVYHNCEPESLELTLEEKEYLAQKQEITVCADPNWMPFEMIKGDKIVGMSADYLKLISSKLKTPFKLIPSQSWMESIALAKARKCDIFSLAMETPERKKYMNFTEPHLSIPLVIATTTEKLFVTDLKEVLDKEIGVVKGYAFTELLKIKYPKIKLVEYDNIEAGLEAVEKKKVYGFIDNLTTIAYQMQKKYDGSLKITGRIDVNWELGIGVRNDDTTLFSVINKAVLSIDEKTRQKIRNEWSSVQYNKQIDYTLIWKVMGVTGLIFLVLLVILYRLMEVKRYNAKLTELNRELERLSTTDSLTEIYNRRFLDHSIHGEYERVQRYGGTFSLILLDIDNFKMINDNYGHDEGDHVLKAISEILKEASRINDLVGRWGGEEFMVICPNASADDAWQIAEKMRHAIENKAFGVPASVTASFGVLECHPSESYHWHITSVDKALYEAKNRGKNIVHLM